MAVSGGWTTGHATVPLPQLRPSSTSSSSPDTCPFDRKKFNFPNKLFLKKNNNKNSKTFCHCSSNNSENNSENDYSNNGIKACNSTTDCTPSREWDWNSWTRHFTEIEQVENYASLLKFELEDAIEKEDFQEAARLKRAIAETTSKDTIAEIMSQLKHAIDEERYHDASRLCRDTGSGLVGWWVGYSKDSDDPFGRLIKITPGIGRFIGKSYTPRQLMTSSPGTPLFEIFVVTDANERYTMQVVFLKRSKGSSANSSSSPDKSSKRPLVTEIDNASVVDVKVEEKEQAEKNEGKSIDLEGAAEEGIKSVINFLKEKIPELKVKVMKVNLTEEITEESIKQLIEEDNENTIIGENADDEESDFSDNEPDQVEVEVENRTGDEKDLDMKLFIGGVLHNREDTPTKDDFVRLAADIKDMEKDSFVLHIPKKYQDEDKEENLASKVTVAAIASQGVSELMPPAVAKAFWGSDKISSKISRDVREIVKLAISQAQKRNQLSEHTNFRRINTSGGDLDPFDGLYVGAFGPYGTEVVQLKRKYGNWSTGGDEKSPDVEFFEYVEAVKLTGDLNVPAGQVTFRAKIGKANRVSKRGMYLDELGVVASYRGEGRIADFGFRNPRWVDGELLQLNGKGMGPYMKGADLGFLYAVPDQSFLVLFNRLKLPN